MHPVELSIHVYGGATTSRTTCASIVACVLVVMPHVLDINDAFGILCGVTE